MELTAFAFEIKEGVAHITLNQPERGNPFDRRFAEEFDYLATECTIRATGSSWPGRASASARSRMALASGYIPRDM